MSGDEEEAEEEEQQGQQQEEQSEDDAQSQLEDYASQPQAREPWDQRGKNGLYGGGGRGADDRETGWVTNYGIGGGATQASSGVEEDLRYDGGREEGRTQRMSSRGTFRAARRRSSSGTEHSSYGPVTPTNTSFSGPSGGPQIVNPESGYRLPPPPTTKTTESQPPPLKHSYSNPAPPMPEQTQPPLSPPSTLKKKTSPSSNKVVASGVPITPLVNPMQHVDTTLLNTTRRKPAFKWTGRSKKAPTISAPILPEGFVESLGMDTFALTPGCAGPNHLLHSGASSTSDAGVSDRDSSASSIKSGSKKDQDRAPRPRKIPNRANFLPALKLGSSALNLSLSSSSSPEPTSSSPPAPVPAPIIVPAHNARLNGPSPLPTPVRLPLNALRNSTTSSGNEHDSSDYSHEISDAFRRLSRESDVSYAPSSKTIASAEKTRRLYFNGIREERARQADQEVQANRGVVPANAPAIPAIPTRYQDEVDHSPSQNTPVNRHGSADSAFRNPWGATASRNSGGSFQHSTPVNRGSHGFNGADRHGSISSHRTIGQRPPSAAYQPKTAFAAPLVEQSDSQDSYTYGYGASRSASGSEEERRAERERERQGSTSSAYSENSNINDYLSPDPQVVEDQDSFRSTPSPSPFQQQQTAPLRRGSVLPSSYSNSISTAPLNFSKRPQQEERVHPSAQGTTGPSGGFNNWGHREEERAAPRSEPEQIGGTGFRNPFG